MRIFHDLEDQEGKLHRFRRRHPDESYSGRNGVWAILVLKDFAFEVVHVEACNDLGVSDEPQVRTSRAYKRVRAQGSLAIAVCVTNCTECACRLADGVAKRNKLAA